ncbi:PDZ domain-containing protein [Noviherbaspirillum sp. 17J57-3]|uniref:PDZ domain-containing protein n=2 Tax=Noviherbaspirillum galbum TaxID=2709383 RepID=A0A6B3SZU3_9BURK|nr:PDZ domain-containing protein [Noviherbaspirillum galbum]
MKRRAFLGTALCAAAALSRAVEPPRDISIVQDFDELWKTLADRYCFFDQKATDWNRVRAMYRPMALRLDTEEEFQRLAHRVLNELYDAHTGVNNAPDGMPRYPWYDLVTERHGDTARVIAVKEGSPAENAGILPGDAVLAADGVPVLTAMRAFLPRCLKHFDPEAERYALNVPISGLRGRPRRLTMRRTAGTSSDIRELTLDVPAVRREPDVSWRRLDGGFGYIRIASFVDNAAVSAFDKALEELREAAALIIDVRRNGGGDTGVAVPMMGRFITERRVYAHMRRREGSGLGGYWREYVDPRGPFTYASPVAVLTDRWSASMAEGFPMGMRGIGRATIIGQPMMGLGAAVFSLRCDRTGIQAQYSAEPVYDANRRWRSLMRPDIVVPEGADIMDAALRYLAAATSGNRR